ncbi:hypothetical protein ACX40Y_14485 [Sphingomonas sp. RS6]
MFQPLISAFFAGTAALVSARVIWAAARLTDSRERDRESDQTRRRLSFVANLLSIEIQGLRRRARAVEGTIRVIRASNKALTEDGANKCRLDLPTDVDDWEKIGLIPHEIQRDLFTFRRLLGEYNDNMQAGQTFASDQAAEQVNHQLGLIATQGSKLVGALMLLAKDNARA